MPGPLIETEDPTIEHAPIRQDEIAEEVYAARQYTKRVTRTVVIAQSLVIVLLGLLVYALAIRPPKRLYFKIDELSRATPVKYTDIEDYTPDAGVARNYIQDWARYRYQRLRGTVDKSFPLNYLFLEKKYGEQIRNQDQQANVVAKILAGREPENDVKFLAVNLLSFGRESQSSHLIQAGTAEVALQKIFTQQNRTYTQSWIVAIRFYINPAQVDMQSREHPEYQQVNPLGLTITSFIPNRVPGEIKPMAGGER